VVLQAQEYSSSGLFEYPIDGAVALVRESRALGALPIMFPEWARRGVPETQRIYDLHLSIARAAPACVPPIPQAWDLSIARNPDIELHADDGNTTVRLHWPAQPGQRFRLQLASSADLAFEKVLLDTQLDSPAWTASNLPPGTYLVRIQVLDPTGLESDFSAPRQIRMGSGVRTGSGLPVSTTSGQPVGRS
jgi:hypothetical protein